jgi:hypothetical protein
MNDYEYRVLGYAKMFPPFKYPYKRPMSFLEKGTRWRVKGSILRNSVWELTDFDGKLYTLTLVEMDPQAEDPKKLGSTTQVGPWWFELKGIQV